MLTVLFIVRSNVEYLGSGLQFSQAQLRKKKAEEHLF